MHQNFQNDFGINDQCCFDSKTSEAVLNANLSKISAAFEQNDLINNEIVNHSFEFYEDDPCIKPHNKSLKILSNPYFDDASANSDAVNCSGIDDCCSAGSGDGHFKIENKINKKNLIYNKLNKNSNNKNNKSKKAIDFDASITNPESLSQLYDPSTAINTNTVCYSSNENLKFFNPIESSFNFQGNYQNYITRVIRSLTPLFSINFTPLIDQRLVLLPEYNKKKTLILDLDETLIHADFDGRFQNPDHTIYFRYEEEEVVVDIFLRPGLHEFLKRVSEKFEIFIFTASKKEYADACIDYIDPERKIVKHRLYRDSCIPINNKIYLKDLRIFVNRKQENLILVDNSFYSFTNQPRNGVLINSFYDDQNDKELLNLVNYLENYLYPSQDIRTINEQIFNFAGLIDQCKNLSDEKK